MTPAIFQQAMDLTFSDLPGIYAYLNDIVILDSSQQETQYPLALCKARLQGEVGNSELKNANSKEIKYLGRIINFHGFSAEQEATSAVVNVPKPTSVPEVQSFFGMVNYYEKFIPHLHQLKHSLEEFIRKNQPWV